MLTEDILFYRKENIMLENQISTLRRILSDEDLQHYAGDCFWNLIQMVTFSDPFAGIAAGKDMKELIFHIPTILFWDKMKRYLSGTFSCFDDQAKMTEKFNKDSNKYNDFVKKQIHLINEIDDDKKVDYFASLTRCFLLTAMDETLFFKLSKFLITCTPEELQFIADIDFEYCGKTQPLYLPYISMDCLLRLKIKAVPYIFFLILAKL